MRLFTAKKLKMIVILLKKVLVNGIMNKNGGFNIVKIRIKKGFTLIELVMVIVILGILAVTAIASFRDLQQQAKEASEKAVVGGVREGLVTYYAENRRFPDSLDNASAGVCSSDNPFFTNVLAQGGITEDWTKIDNTHYQGPTETLYTYTPSGADAGSFK